MIYLAKVLNKLTANKFVINAFLEIKHHYQMMSVKKKIKGFLELNEWKYNRTSGIH